MKKMTPTEKRGFVKALGVALKKPNLSYQYVLQIATNADKPNSDLTKRLAGPKFCKAVEKVTSKRHASDNCYPGVVFKYNIRPDIFDKPAKVKA